MSLGFLTESALVPSKAKPIKVDSKSLVDLKAIVFRKEQERRNQEDGKNLRYKRGVRVRHEKASKKGRKYDDDSNAGIEKRRQRDEDEDALLGEDERSKKKRSRQILIEKAKLYDQLARGERVLGPNDHTLIDFKQKEFHKDHDFSEASKAAHGSVLVEIIDEFGRSKQVSRDGDEHVAFISGQSHDEKRSVGTSGSYVVSQWEKTLNARDKSFLSQVQEETKQAKMILMDKNQRKEDRLQKIKQAFSRDTAAILSKAADETIRVTREATTAADEFLSSL
jgi:hypothetical protein